MTTKEAPPELVDGGAGEGGSVGVNTDTLQAGSLPVFDYDGALAVARSFESLAEEVESTHASRVEDRDAAASKWEGNFGTEFKERNTDEDASAKNVADALRANAQSWAVVWAETVNEANRVLRAHAWEDHQRLKRIADAQRGNLEKAGDAIGDFFSGRDSGLDSSTLPWAARVGAPAAPGFSPPANPFARYVVTSEDVDVYQMHSEPRL